MKNRNTTIRFLLFMILMACTQITSAQTVWSGEKAFKWYAQQPWLAGCNYLPVTAINQLEMWQAESFDTVAIEKELALAESIGFNTLRVFLHDKLWVQDAKGFIQRVNIFLGICSKHRIRPMLVFFDSCWDPFPAVGKQHDPVPGLHNSGWVQSPGATVLTDPAQYDQLKQYVKGMIRAFGHDNRILCWDMWNEPDNTNGSSYGAKEPKNKVEIVNRLLPEVFKWARSEKPVQPLTSGLWTWWDRGWDKDSSKNLTATERIQLANSDIITFHCYEDSATFHKQMKALLAHGRPVICSEYMARGNKSTVMTVMPVARQYNVGMINWGFADGKEQTKYPWDSWEKRYTSDPPLWHHILFKADYTPYIPEEIEFIKKMTEEKVPRTMRTTKRDPQNSLLTSFMLNFEHGFADTRVVVQESETKILILDRRLTTNESINHAGGVSLARPGKYSLQVNGKTTIINTADSLYAYVSLENGEVNVVYSNRKMLYK